MATLRVMVAALLIAFGGWVPDARGQSSVPLVGVESAPDVTIFRVFLRDGSSLVSYGEITKLADRVVFSMPTTASAEDPRLQLVTLAARYVDWDRTDRYAETARAARYVATEGPRQYAMLSADIGQALNDVALTTDPAARLAIVERARKTLAEWPTTHFGYKEAEIREMVAILDETIADLRAAAGIDRFDLSLSTATEQPREREELLPAPTPKEAIEQTLTAARLADSPVERVSLMTIALAVIEHDAERLPSDWRTEVRATVRASLAKEAETDRQYQRLSAHALTVAKARAKAADVRGLERLLLQIHQEDQVLGAKRPDTVQALRSTIEEQLDAARALRLARDRWALRIVEVRKYYEALVSPVDRLSRLSASLEDIKAMAGSTPSSLSTIERTAEQILEVIALLNPPDELKAAHTLLVSAAQLAASAARIRREAALSGDMTRAWDASSAAAGALMLTARVRTEMQNALNAPQPPQ